jgi:ornithine cyclodeaminase
MSAWQNGAFLGVKIVTVFPRNASQGVQGLNSSYLLCDGDTDCHLALIDGNTITSRRARSRPRRWRRQAISREKIA